MVTMSELLPLLCSSLFGMVFLVAGVGGLVYTFVWLARLWWRQLGKSHRPECWRGF